MASLDRIQVRGFKSIKEMDLELGSLNIMIGANGSGKSNFISLFLMMKYLIYGNLVEYVASSGGADCLLYYGQKVTNEISIGLKIGESGYRSILAANTKDELFFKDEAIGLLNLDLDLWGLKRINRNRNWYESSLSTERGSDFRLLFDRIKKIDFFHFNDTSKSSKIKKHCKIDDNRSLHDDGSNIAAILYLLKEDYKNNYDNIVKRIRLIAPFFGDFLLEPNRRNKSIIRLRWKEKKSEIAFNADSLSDGTLRFICLATLLLQPEELLPQTIIIDEPELGLHPSAIKLLAGMIKSISSISQVIVSTQSSILINEFLPEDIIVVEREEEEEGEYSVFRRLSSGELEQWLEEYDMATLWDMNILGGKP